MKRPEGSNADEWLLFLREYIDVDCNPLPFFAVQIAEAIDEHNVKLVAALKEVEIRIKEDYPNRALHVIRTALQQNRSET